MKYIPQYRLTLVRERTLKTENRTIISPRDAYDILLDFIGTADREHFVALMLDTRNRCIGIHVVSIGTLNASLVHPRDFWKAMILANANAVIIAHNHPSHDVTPSQEDLALTKRLSESGELFGIPILDSLIIGDGDFFSMKERGMLPGERR